MEETIKLELAGGLDAPSRARIAIQALDGSLGGRRQAVRLVISELIGNCVRHSGAGPDARIGLELSASPEGVRVEVICPGPGFEAKLQPRPEEGRGLGFQIVDTLSERWGVEGSHPARVWAELK